jgi:hypothetical protein
MQKQCGSKISPAAVAPRLEPLFESSLKLILPELLATASRTLARLFAGGRVRLRHGSSEKDWFENHFLRAIFR